MPDSPYSTMFFIPIGMGRSQLVVGNYFIVPVRDVQAPIRAKLHIHGPEPVILTGHQILEVLRGHTPIRISHDPYSVDRTGDRVCQKCHVCKLGRKTPGTILSKGQTGYASPPYAKIMEGGHKWLVRSQSFIPNSWETGPRLHRGHRVSQIIGFGTIPLTVASQLKPPDIIEPGINQLHFRTFQIETTDLTVIHANFSSTNYRGHLSFIQGPLTKINPICW